MARLVAAAAAAVSLSGCSGGTTTDATRSTPPSSGPAVVTNSATSSIPRASGLTGRLIFTRAGGMYGDDTIFAADANGHGQRRITGFGENCCPRLSHDGREVLFAASAPGNRVTIGIKRYDGTGFRRLPLPNARLNFGPGAWSPDAHEIAVQGWDDRQPAHNGAYLVRAGDGSVLRRLTRAPLGGNDVPVDFSPDGKWIVIFREPSSQTNQSIGSLLVIGTDGRGMHRVTPPQLTTGPSARWSPDGTQILFASSRDAPAGGLWTVHPEGTHLRKVFQDPSGGFAISPTWSPTGTQIMFGLDPDADEFAHPPNQLCVINTDGTGLALVLGGNDFKREPDWRR